MFVRRNLSYNAPLLKLVIKLIDLGADKCIKDKRGESADSTVSIWLYKNKVQTNYETMIENFPYMDEEYTSW